MRSLLLVLLGLALGAPLASARAQLRPGMYESTLTIKLPDEADARVQTLTRCVNASEARDPTVELLRGVAEDGDCRLLKRSLQNGHFLADLSCRARGQDIAAHIDVTI
jgi:hypothetical protein